MWFKCHFGITGDWFGGSVAHNFGPGVKDTKSMPVAGVVGCPSSRTSSISKMTSRHVEPTSPLGERCWKRFASWTLRSSVKEIRGYRTTSRGRLTDDDSARDSATTVSASAPGIVHQSTESQPVTVTVTAPDDASVV